LGACLPGGGAATAPAGLDDLVSALMSAEGVALLKARTETATSAWAAAAGDARAAREATGAAAAGGNGAFATTSNDVHATFSTRSKNKGRRRWSRFGGGSGGGGGGGGGVSGIFRRIFWAFLSFIAMFRAALTRLGGASGGGGGGSGIGGGGGPAGGWLRTARRQRAVGRLYRSNPVVTHSA
jgi:hypothetical protein